MWVFGRGLEYDDMSVVGRVLGGTYGGEVQAVDRAAGVGAQHGTADTGRKKGTIRPSGDWPSRIDTLSQPSMRLEEGFSV